MSRGKSPSFNDDDLPLSSPPPSRRSSAGASVSPASPPVTLPSPSPVYPMLQPQVVPQKRHSNGCNIVATSGALLVLGVILFTQLPKWLQSGPTLEGSVSIAPSSVIDLSTEGTLDWIHWGYLESDNASAAPFIGNPITDDCQTNYHCTNRKQNANPQISDFTPFGSFDSSKLPYRLYGRDVFTRFFWNDGSPISSATNARTTDYMAGVGNGFQIQVPADQTTHTLRIYLALWQAKLKFAASLSDGSAPDYVDTSVQPRAYYDDVYTVTYKAASPSQTLTVTLALLSDYGGANVSLIAATLQ